MDRKSLIGFVLMMAMAAGYFWYSSKEAKTFEAQKQYEDSIAQAQKPALQQAPAADSNTNITATDSLILQAADSGKAPGFTTQKGELVKFSNGLLTVQFNTKGAAPQVIQLDSFKTYSQKDLVFTNDTGNIFNISLPFQGSIIQTKDLNFQSQINTVADGAQQLELKADLGSGKAIIYTYTLPKNSYMMQAQLRLVGLQSDLNGATALPLEWITKPLNTEKDIKNERNSAQVHYWLKDKDEHDYFTIKMTNTKEIGNPLKWMTVKTHFFNSTIIADQQFEKGSFKGEIGTDSSTVFSLKNQLYIPITASNDIAFNYKWMMGPNKYDLFKSYNLGLEEMIQYGFGIFFFVKYIVMWVVIPIFSFLEKFIGSYGLIIILLTLIIRAFLSFFSYKSYLSSAKMRALKPELDLLKEKYGDDQQKMGIEQMNLYRTAGVNPLGGCLPMLLQMPFLLSMYYFFPTAIELRQQKFLWAEDLSTYDSIFSWTGDIPLITSFYGNHVSLFTLLMGVSSLLLAMYSRNMTPTTGGNDINAKMMKWMPFVMPIMFLPWFNSFAAGLTFYYTFSNLISLAQQYIIQKFFINEQAILDKIHQKRKAPAKTSKWQQKLEEMQKMQQDKMKNQGKK